MTAATRTQVTIRPFTPEDYPALARVSNAVYTDYPNSVDELRFGDEHRDPKCHFARFMAERAGEVVGLAEVGQSAGMFHPRKFWLGVTVAPEWQGRGIGAALYDHALASLDPFAPLSVRGGTRSDWTRSLRFLEARGFVEQMRAWESRLDVAAFDPSPYAGVEERVAAGGLVITTFAALAADPERDRKLYELDRDLSADVPHPEPHTPISYEFFIDRVLSDPDLIPEAYFVAIDAATGEYAGMSQLWHSQGSDDLYNGLTGVRRAYRRRGLALALKLRGIAYAKAQGRPTIKTWNESNNRAMLSINEALGFVKQPIWIDFVKRLREDDAQVENGTGDTEMRRTMGEDD
jgi:GNAT superfamily N-acetyltransferase